MAGRGLGIRAERGPGARAQGGGARAGLGAGRGDHADGGERRGNGFAGARIEDVAVATAGVREGIVGVAGGGEGLAGEIEDVGQRSGAGGLLDGDAPRSGAGGGDVAADLDVVVGGAERRQLGGDGVGGEALGHRGKIRGEIGGRFSQRGRGGATFEATIADAGAGGGDFGRGGRWAGAALRTEAPQIDERENRGVEGSAREDRERAAIGGDAGKLGRDGDPIGGAGGVEAREFGVGAVSGKLLFEAFEGGRDAGGEGGGIERWSRLEEFHGPRRAEGAAGEGDRFGGKRARGGKEHNGGADAEDHGPT